jgi:hypothetical protein
MTGAVGVPVVPGWKAAFRDVDAAVVVDRAGGELDRNPREVPSLVDSGWPSC